ncbi:thermonuclease family protein [Sandarakinorhabdus oryzae]|uniref:thermonuclease family protein n=1 Tax=Sandarakinorhabdus oryzae TaxID=2675220 RepID=UPI0012E2DCEC|nr:thermonuclease family protein [Sandarakinorhabdus oryzae]
MIIAPDEPEPATLEEALKATVIRVFDGDGFLARVWNPFRQAWVERVPFRFAFIDAPEMGQPFGQESKVFLERLIADRSLRLDPVGKESTGFIPVDPYKRMLCMAFLSDQLAAGKVTYFMNRTCSTGTARSARAVTRNVELEMVVNGWAWVTQQYAFDRADDYFAAQEDAQHSRRGLWAMDKPEPPWSFKRRERQRKLKSAGQGNLL